MGGIFNYLMYLFSDCCKYQNDPEYKEIIVQKQNMYDQYSKNDSLDPLWQDRRMMSFYIFRPINNDKAE